MSLLPDGHATPASGRTYTLKSNQNIFQKIDICRAHVYSTFISQVSGAQMKTAWTCQLCRRYRDADERILNENFQCCSRFNHVRWMPALSFKSPSSCEKWTEIHFCRSESQKHGKFLFNDFPIKWKFSLLRPPSPLQRCENPSHLKYHFHSVIFIWSNAAAEVLMVGS